MSRDIQAKNPSSLRKCAMDDIRMAHESMRGLLLSADQSALTQHMLNLLGVAESGVRMIQTNTNAVAAVTVPPGLPNVLGVATAKMPASYAIAHAQVMNHCIGRRLGCGFHCRGNAIGRHQKNCEHAKAAKAEKSTKKKASAGRKKAPVKKKASSKRKVASKR